MLSLGYGNYINEQKIVGITDPASAPIKRLIKHAKKVNSLIDMSAGHRSKSVVILEEGVVCLSANAPETLNARLSKEKE